MDVEKKPDFQYAEYFQAPTKITSTEEAWILTDEKAGISLNFHPIRDDIFKLAFHHRLAPCSGFSYGVSPDLKASRHPWRHFESKASFEFCSLQLRVQVSKTTGQIKISRSSGEVLLQTSRAYAASFSTMNGFMRASCLFENAWRRQYYGLGDKAGTQLLNGSRFENWNTDAFGYQLETDPLYRSIPFFYAHDDEGAFGFYLDNSYRSTFDFGKQSPNELQITAEGPPYQFYFFDGPSLKDVSRKYHLITGHPPLPPHWSLGYHQCRWSYYPDQRVLEIANSFRHFNIPCDCIYLDIDYMDAYKCFTWHPKRFPDPSALIEKLHQLGFKVVSMIDPGISATPGYSVFEQGLSINAFCKQGDGSLVMGPVWPEQCVFPDFTDPEVRAWWGGLYQKLYVDDLLDGFWNDMNEPAIIDLRIMTFPDQARHSMEGEGGNHERAHNIYGMQMSRATFEGLQSLRPERRPFVLTRASFSGGQRYAAVWTGDNTASWEHLAMANRQCQRLAISGFSFCGTDIGGFDGNPDPELYTRWLQLGAFHPLFRTHSIGHNVNEIGALLEDPEEEEGKEIPKDQEPWVFGAPFTAYNRRAIELRYRLFPYLYTAFYQNSTQGLPVLRPLVFDYPNDPIAKKREREFMFGNALLVAPIFIPGIKTIATYFPSGRWYNYWTHEIHAGAQFLRIETPLSQIPVYVKEGCIIPEYPVRQNTAASISHLILKVFTANTPISTIVYEDSGDGYTYLEDQNLIRTIEVQQETDHLILTQTVEGNFAPGYDTIQVQIIGLENRKFRLSTGKLERLASGEVSIEVPSNFRMIKLSW